MKEDVARGFLWFFGFAELGSSHREDFSSFLFTDKRKEDIYIGNVKNQRKRSKLPGVEQEAVGSRSFPPLLNPKES